MNHHQDINCSQIKLVNIVEPIVKSMVKEVMAENGTCDCEVCYLNACAIALNAIEPKYVTTTKGALLEEVSTVEPINYTSILVEVTKAVMQVAKNPHHDHTIPKMG